MTTLLPELGDLPARGVFDGEIVAFAVGLPHFPLVCERLLHGNRSISLTFVLFDVLELDGETVIGLTYAERRALLEDLALGAGPWFIAESFADGAALFEAACSHGLEGVVAKRRLKRYCPRGTPLGQSQEPRLLALRRRDRLAPEEHRAATASLAPRGVSD
jgi:bifunctional non-homologous end joining protein LigD